MRFSIVLELDDDSKDAVLSVQSKFSAQFPTVQWLERDQLYLTVKFLGNPLKRFHKELKKKLSEVTCGIAPFEIAITKAGCFPTEGPERVVWLGIEEKSGMLERFARECDRAYNLFNITSAEGDFIPHIVLGRVQLANSKGKLRKTVESTTVSPLIKKCSEASLILSRMDKHDGTKYEVIARSSFGAVLAN